MKWSFVLLFASSLFGADGPRLFYSKNFPNSVPAYVQVTLDKSGEAEYREAVDDDLPLKFKLSEAEVAEVYGLVEKLDYFKHPVESGLKVAFMGTKTFGLTATGFFPGAGPAGAVLAFDRIRQDVDLITVRLNYTFGGPSIAKY